MAFLASFSATHLSSPIAGTKSLTTFHSKSLSRKVESHRFATLPPIKSVIGADHYVRFTPESGHLQCTSACPLWAKSGHSVTIAQRATRRLATPIPCQKITFSAHRAETLVRSPAADRSAPNSPLFPLAVFG